jgi:hypothetical protein
LAWNVTFSKQDKYIPAYKLYGSLLENIHKEDRERDGSITLE